MNKPENPAAFPMPEGERNYQADGMELRDYFAAAALQGCSADVVKWVYEDSGRQILAKQVYALADAMLAERSKK